MGKKKMNIYICDELREAVERLACERGDSISDTCTRLIRTGLNWEPTPRMHSETGDKPAGTTRTLVSLPTALNKTLKIEGVRRGMVVTALFREALWEWVDKHCGDAQSSEEKQR